MQVAPQQETIGGGYVTPAVQKPLPRDYWLQVLDVVLLAAAMGVSVWLVLSRRSRTWVLALTVACLAYFGFYREGCICPIGSIQNVAVALTDPRYSIPIVVTAVFFLPLLVALFFGRAFCGGVCPLGAIQELVVLKPVQVPRRLDRALGLLKYVYLGLAIWLAVQPLAARDFVICRFDPFVGFFRRDGLRPHADDRRRLPGAGHVRRTAVLPLPVPLRRAAVVVLAAGRPRRHASRPDKELDCGLCAEACPYGAIEKMRAVRPKTACTARAATPPARARRTLAVTVMNPDWPSGSRGRRRSAPSLVVVCVLILTADYVRRAHAGAARTPGSSRRCRSRSRQDAAVAPKLDAEQKRITAARARAQAAGRHRSRSC